MSKKILLVLKTPMLKCPRPRRLYLALQASQDCYYVSPPELDEVHDPQRYGYLSKAIQSPFIKWLHRLSIKFSWLWLAEKIETAKYRLPRITDGEFDFITVHDLYVLPHVSHFVKTKVIFDAREYYPLEFSEDQQWGKFQGKLARYVCKKHMPKAYKVLTVSPSIVELYKKLLKRDVLFFPSYPREELLVCTHAVSVRKPRRFIHHGNAFKNRGLERMVQLMLLLGEEYQLDMMLVASPGNQYFTSLVNLIDSVPNVNLLEPVHPDEIANVCSHYDMGLYLMEVNDSQNRYCLPNKYFEFLYAGLPVISSFSQDMKQLTEEYGLGLGFSDESLQHIAQHIRDISDAQYLAFKQAVASTVPHWTVTNNIKRCLPELIAAEGSI